MRIRNGDHVVLLKDLYLSNGTILIPKGEIGVATIHGDILKIDLGKVGCRIPDSRHIELKFSFHNRLEDGSVEMLDAAESEIDRARDLADRLEKEYGEGLKKEYGK